MAKKNIQKLAFIDPNGKNLKEVKNFIYKVINELLHRSSKAEKYPPLPKNSNFFDKFNLNDLPITESQIFKQIKLLLTTYG